MFDLPKEIVVFDTEYTTWEGAQERKWRGPGEHREIVQLGAVRIETDTFSEVDFFDLYILPQINPTLSKYFIELTDISQDKINREGVKFQEALNKFSSWSSNLDLYCYGSDGQVIEENYKLLGISSPILPTKLYNIKTLFKNFGIPADDYYSSTIVKAFGEEPVRRGHNALNDSRTIVDGLRLLRKKFPKEGNSIG